MQNTVVDEVLFDTLHLCVDVAFPKQNCQDDVAVVNLEKIHNREDPLVLFAL